MSIGLQLRKAREARSLDLEQVAQATHIRIHYLRALESGDFNALPSTTQARGFIRAYAGYLRLDAEPLLAALDWQTSTEDILAVPLPTQAEMHPAITPADTISVELGQKLHSQRELLGLSIEDVERHTHIRAHYVQALESGDLDGLPSPVQGRGMLNNYANFLGLDSEPLMLRFADGLQASLAARQSARSSQRPVSASVPPRRSTVRHLFSTDVILGAFVVVFLVGFTIWATLRISDLRSGGDPTPTGLSIADILSPSETVQPSSTASLAPDSLTTEATVMNTVPPGAEEVVQVTEVVTTEVSALITPTPDFGTLPIQLYVIASQRAWMRVSVDGEVAFEGRVLAGSAYPFAGKVRIVILTGNGAGLQVLFNQQDLGTLGFLGEVVERIFTLQGMQTPTPSVSLTPTLAPTSTSTPEGTPGTTVIPTP